MISQGLPHRDSKARRLCGLPLIGSDYVVLDHRVDHLVSPRKSTIRMFIRRVDERRFDEAGEQRRLSDIQLIRLLAKVILRCRLNSDLVITEPGAICINGQQFVARVAQPQVCGCACLFKIPLQRPGKLAVRMRAICVDSPAWPGRTFASALLSAARTLCPIAS